MAGSVLILVEGDGVDRHVQSTIAAAVEPTSGRVALRFRDRAGPRDLFTVGFEVGVPASGPLRKTNSFAAATTDPRGSARRLQPAIMVI